MHNNRRQQVVNKAIGRVGALGMDNCCLVCCMLLLVIFSLATGVPCLYYGNKCKNADLRAEHKNGLCKNIHSDESAIALQVFATLWYLVPNFQHRDGGEIKKNGNFLECIVLASFCNYNRNYGC